MLVDAQLKQPDGVTALVLSVVSGFSGGGNPEKIGTGMYVISHHNPDLLLNKNQWEAYWDDDDDISSYGVCDTPQQLIEKPEYKSFLFLNSRDYRFCIFFTPVHKKDQPAEGGWRWHKWGPYEGTKTPMCEHLYDEPTIETVYCFHIFKQKLD